MTFKPTTEPWSPGGGELELEALLILADPLLILADPLKGGTVIRPWRYMPRRFGSQQNGPRRREETQSEDQLEAPQRL